MEGESSPSMSTPLQTLRPEEVEKEEEEEPHPHHHHLHNHNVRDMKIVVPTSNPTSPFKLPDDWVVEKRPRNYTGRIDTYYYEPGTGQQFRSLKAVAKYLTEAKENTPKPKLLKPGNHVRPSQNSRSQKKNISSEKKKTSTSDSVSPPAKINWVLTGLGGDRWSPFMGESLVPESIRQQWAKEFILSVNDRNSNAPSSKS